MPEHEQPMIQTIKAYDARQHWSELLTTVFRRERRYVVEKSGIPVAAVVSMEDLARLRQLEGAAPTDAAAQAPELVQRFEEVRRRNREVPMDVEALFAPPTSEQTSKRQAVLAQIQAHLPQRVITPLTAADLIHEARAEEEEAYGVSQ